MVKKRRNLPNWLCFTAKRREDHSIQRLRHVIVSRQSSHSMTSCPQQIAVPFAVCIFGGFGEMPWRPLPPKIQGCRIDQQIQRWLMDQLQEQFNVQIECLMFCKAIRHYLCLRCTILHYAEPFDATLHRLCVRCATRRYPEPFNATLHRLSTVLQMSAKLFVIELVHFTISCSNSTWATRPFIIWLNYPCLECSVSRRKTRPSMPFLY